jgi:predicted dehydrogenase
MAWRETGHDRSAIASNPGNAPMIATRNLLDRTLRAFIDGTPAPASGEAGRDTLKVLAAAYVSAAQGRRVALDDPAVTAYTFEA